jgi:TetR/AcrR family transcriptional regulator, ethionamide resistance regulator
LTKKTNSSQADKALRRRRKPEAAESEILSAAENFLRESPLRDMTIDDVMSRTGLSRPSFYEYFRDRSQLVIKLTERLGARNLAIGETWLHGQNSIEDLRRVMLSLAELYVTEGHLLRALADAATTDRQVEASYRKMLDWMVEGIAQKIRTEIDQGAITITDLEPREIARALLLMNERYLIEKLGLRPPADPKTVAETLFAIWTRVLYGNSR